MQIRIKETGAIVYQNEFRTYAQSQGARFGEPLTEEFINQYGGEIGETYGVPVEQICEGIKHGVRKINIDTDLRLVSTGAIRQFLAKNKAEFDPRKYLKETIKEMKAICVARYEAFGTAGNADKIKVIDLERMYTRYEKGELVQKVN